jgi:hypothetical protein
LIADGMAIPQPVTAFSVYLIRRRTHPDRYYVAEVEYCQITVQHACRGIGPLMESRLVTAVLMGMDVSELVELRGKVDARISEVRRN